MAKRKAKTSPPATRSKKKATPRVKKKSARGVARAKKLTPKRTAKKKTAAASAKKTRAARIKKVVKKSAGKRSHAARRVATRRATKRTTSSAKPAVTVQWGSQRIELIDDDKKVPKTKLGKKDLREFARMLLDKRRELVGNMENLSSEAMNSNQGSGGSNMPLHMADVGTDNWEQEFTLGLIENERSLVREIDEALARIENRTYGICLATHRPIDTTRLRAKPWAKYCIEYARLRELGRVP